MSCSLVIYFWLYIMGSVVKTRHKETSTPFNTDVPIRIVSLISWVQKVMSLCTTAVDDCTKILHQKKQKVQCIIFGRCFFMFMDFFGRPL